MLKFQIDSFCIKFGGDFFGRTRYTFKYFKFIIVEAKSVLTGVIDWLKGLFNNDDKKKEGRFHFP